MDTTPPLHEFANARAPLSMYRIPPLTFVFDAYPPLERFIVPPEITVFKADPETEKNPPLDTMVEDTIPPLYTLISAEEEIVVNIALAPE
jgi:hypothetical protein